VILTSVHWFPKLLKNLESEYDIRKVFEFGLESELNLSE